MQPCYQCDILLEQVFLRNTIGMHRRKVSRSNILRSGYTRRSSRHWQQTPDFSLRHRGCRNGDVMQVGLRNVVHDRGVGDHHPPVPSAVRMIKRGGTHGEQDIRTFHQRDPTGSSEESRSVALLPAFQAHRKATRSPRASCSCRSCEKFSGGEHSLASEAGNLYALCSSSTRAPVSMTGSFLPSRNAAVASHPSTERSVVRTDRSLRYHAAIPAEKAAHLVSIQCRASTGVMRQFVGQGLSIPRKRILSPRFGSPMLW